MAITVVNARIYVARIIGGGAESQESLDMANEAILRGYQDWQNKRFWRFLLKDTSNTFTITATPLSGFATITPVTAGDLDFVNVGQTLTSAAYTGTATVLFVTRGTDGVVSSITVDKNALTSSASVMIFSANIPIIAGSNDYGVPNDFSAAFSALLLTNKRPLVWRDQRWWDRTIIDQTVRGTPSEYTTYNTFSDLTQNKGTTRIKFDRIPDVNDTMLFRYYRKFITNGTNIDMIDDFVYQFLDYCRNILLETKRAQDDPAGYAASVKEASEGAAETDEEPTDDNDAENCMKSQWEVGDYGRPLWGNGQFDPYR
jgi:hypothetical protein